MTEGNRPWGGDKVGFEYPKPTEEELEAQDRLREIIEDERENKRNVKAGLERIKELKFSMLEKLAALPELQKLRTSTHVDAELLERESSELLASYADERDKQRLRSLAQRMSQVAVNEEGLIEIKKHILHTYDRHVGSKSGWDWKALKERAEAAGFEYREFDEGEEGMLVGVTFGRDRLIDKADEPGVLVQRGYDGKPATESRRKEYVEDYNEVPTRRYVTRAISHYQVATMIGLRFSGSGDVVESDKTAPGHYPRGDGERFANQENTFNMQEAAVVEPRNWKVDGTRDHTYEVDDHAVKLTHTGLPSYRARTTGDRNATMDMNEASWAQLRNGSGEDQPMLSLAAIQSPVGDRPVKVIRGNKGERFDQSPETVAVIEIDLALAQAEGIEFVNQHSSDSHEYKIAYARWVKVKDEAGTDVKIEKIKREAKDELDEYIYSGRKNREITIQHVTNTIIKNVNFEKGAERFGDGFPFEAGWQPWSSEVEEKLRAYFDPATLQAAKKDADAKKGKGYD